jgi:riboflavin kinase/FMN adenylyltransferase
MQTFRGFPPRPLDYPVYLAIGSFDGIHRGHQALIGRMVSAARAASSLAGLLTFDPHPITVLRPNTRVARLTCNEERSAILASLGLDFVLVLPFTPELAATPASEFMQKLAAHLTLRSLWIGPDFALGRGREGNADLLTSLGRELGYKIRICPPFKRRGNPVRSSQIRRLLVDEGSVEEAGRLLGRPYQVWGQVRHGAHRGRSLGIPTANLQISADRLVPSYGVYACWAWLGESEEDDTGLEGFPAVVNVGVRPTFDNGTPSVEAHLLGFDGDLYGAKLGLSFVRRLRGEKKFGAISDLVAQIRKDTQAARRILARPASDAGGHNKWTWEELPHTADKAIKMQAISQRQLFARAASAMFRIEGADPAESVNLARAIQVSADDTPALFANWLNQLLLAQEVGGELYTHFKIYEISDRGLRATAYGYHGVPQRTLIKAATYHNLTVFRTAKGWAATVTFDV